MPPDEQYALSVRYAAAPVCLILCPSGAVAVTEGLNARGRRLLAILPPDEALAFATQLEQAPIEPEPSLDPFDI